MPSPDHQHPRSRSPWVLWTQPEKWAATILWPIKQWLHSCRGARCGQVLPSLFHFPLEQAAGGGNSGGSRWGMVPLIRVDRVSLQSTVGSTALCHILWHSMEAAKQRCLKYCGYYMHSNHKTPDWRFDWIYSCLWCRKITVCAQSRKAKAQFLFSTLPHTNCSNLIFISTFYCYLWENLLCSTAFWSFPLSSQNVSVSTSLPQLSL